MRTLSRTTRRPLPVRPARLAGLVGAGVLGAAVLVPVSLSATSASAAEPAPTTPLTFAWEVSSAFDSSLPDHALSNGATEDGDGVITFTNGKGAFSPVTGAGSVTYEGTVAASYSDPVLGALVGKDREVTISNPTVTVDDSGRGTVTADVSSASGRTLLPPSEPASTPVSRRTVTTFTIADGSAWALSTAGGVTTGALTTTPAWNGVLPAGSGEATALGIAAGQPVDGKSFAPDFLTGLVPRVRTLFYANGDSGDAAKAPAPLTARGDATTVTLTTLTGSVEDGLRLTMRGRSFSPSTNAGDDGVFVGLAPSGGLPDITRRTDPSVFAGSIQVPASRIVDGSFSAALVVPLANLDQSKTYSVYTWRAPSRSTTTQDTITPVPINWSIFLPNGGLTVDGPTTKRYGERPTITASIPGGVGVMAFTGAGPNQTKDLVDGAATFTIPATLAPGRYPLRFTFTGTGAQSGSTVARTLTVAKASTSVSSSITSPTSAKVGSVLAKVGGATTVAAPTGSATMRILKSGKVVRSFSAKSLSKGRVYFTIPALPKGTYVLQVSYKGSTFYNPSSRDTTFRVTR